uniref:START domain-containing protein n=1 Tax=Phytophthora ramorum TaxID=164328 RepID=H3GE01_PHYRM
MTSTSPKFSDAELLDLLATLDDDDEAELQDVKMEEQTSVWDPSVNLVLDGEMFTSEKDFESFMESRTPGEAISSVTRKQEIDHLRAVAAELEKKLTEHNGAHDLDRPEIDPFWKRVSNQLLEQRRKSVMENARLRDLVRGQMTIVKGFQRSLEKTSALSVSNSSSGTGVDTMLPQSSGPSPSLDGSKKVNIEVETDSNDGLHMCLQVVENKLVPFSFEETIQNQGDEMFGWIKLDNAMGPMQMLGNIAIRQYVEPNKLTIIWECEGDVHQGYSKTRIQPKGWCVFEPAEGDSANTTIFRRCAILSPIIPDDSNSERSIGMTTELVLENYKRTVVYIFDGMLASLNRSHSSVGDMRQAPPLFSEAELLDVLTGIDAGCSKDATAGPSVNVVLNEDVLSSERAFEEFMESLASDDDAGVSTVSDGSQSETASSSKSKRKVDAAATVTPAATSKPKRKRRKHELDHLRAVAAELEKKLQVLNDSSSDEQAGTSNFWKHISNQMVSERQKAVGENARLRQLVREQVKSVKSMQRTLEKTPDLSKMEIEPECSQLQQCQSPTSKELYRDLFKNISSSYTNGVGSLLLQQPCMPTPSLVGKRKMNMEMETVDDCSPRMCLQFVESRLIPFSLVRIGDHAWDFLSGSSGHDNFRMALQNQGNEMFGHCTVNNPAGSSQTLGNIAVRRYYEANKLTFVWECDGLCSHDGAFAMRVHQKGWCVFEPAKEDSENATIFRACARMTPSLGDSDSFTNSAKTVAQTTEMVIENYEKTIVYIFDAVLESLAAT